VADGRIDVEPLLLQLFAGDDQVDVVAAAQTVIRYRQEAVCIGRQIDAHDIGFLIRDMIDKAGVLVGKAVVILSPNMRGQQVIQRCDRKADFEPLGVLAKMPGFLRMHEKALALSGASHPTIAAACRQ
jgi:hypothetical protein